MINYEIKSQLAKLLATENLVVENKNVKTASFDVERRVLTLPMWNRASNVVFDMLVGHEVGHALFTPNEWSWEKDVPQAFVNVTEDARIEKLMKRKFPGLAKSFYKGYSELSDRDFFEIRDRKLNKLSLADRINLYYKIGNYVDIPFTIEEKILCKRVGETETFEEAVEIAKEIHKYSKGQKEQKQELDNVEKEPEGFSGGEEEGEEEDQKAEEPKAQEEPEETEEWDDESDSSEEVTTDDTFNEKVSEFSTDNFTNDNTEYYEVPKIDYDKIVVSNSMIHEIVDQHEDWLENPDKLYSADITYNKFKKDAQKEVNYLVKEFECRKSADAYSRTATARTGVLDCSKLHTYKYNEDLFKKVNVVPDGKNHGLIFVLDWSGSMAESMENTIKQLYNLIWFCSKVNIPFEVYAFSNTSRLLECTDGTARTGKNEPIENDFVITSDFEMINLFTSKVNKKTLDKQMKSIYRIAYYYSGHYVQYSVPRALSLSGTPLNEALVSLHTLLPKFKRENKLQKVQCVILTDGEAHQLYRFGRSTLFKSSPGELSPRSIWYNSYLRNRKTGYTYEIGYTYWSFTDVLLKDLKQTFPDTNFIGIRLTPSRDFASFLKRYTSLSGQEMNQARKDKSYTIKGSGYDAYFAMIQNSLFSDSSLDVEEGESKTKIKSAFMKSLKAKSLNKKVLSQFMDLVC